MNKEIVILVLEFKNPVNFKNGYLAECKFPIGKNPEVMINDISKDTLSTRYENEKGETLTRVGNPKIAKMTRDEFFKIFKIVHIRKCK